MSRGLLIFLAIAAVLCFYGCGSYNGLVSKDENANGKWAQVQTQYQRRSDLIPNLVNTVQGAANFEKGTLTEVINARAKATSIQLKADDLSPEKIKQFEEAQNQLKGSLSRLMVVAENYPNLKANENFKELQAQLEGTENRITVARKDFNEAVQDYNQSARVFPNSIFAGIFNFKTKGYFEGSQAAQTAPVVKF